MSTRTPEEETNVRRYAALRAAAAFLGSMGFPADAAELTEKAMGLGISVPEAPPPKYMIVPK